MFARVLNTPLILTTIHIQISNGIILSYFFTIELNRFFNLERAFLLLSGGLYPHFSDKKCFYAFCFSILFNIFYCNAYCHTYTILPPHEVILSLRNKRHWYPQLKSYIWGKLTSSSVSSKQNILQVHLLNLINLLVNPLVSHIKWAIIGLKGFFFLIYSKEGIAF